MFRVVRDGAIDSRDSMSQPGRKIILLAIVAVSALLSLAGAFILTDAGQIFDISKEVVIGYFRVHLFVMSIAVGLMLAVLGLNRVWKVLRRWQEAIFVMVVVGGLLATKFATPYVMFPSKQHTAVYKSVSDVDGYLQLDDTVYVVERNGVARAFPQRLIWQAHIFGGDYGGDDWMFNTVDLDDDRLHSKEKIVGIADGDEAVAYTREALVRAGLTNVSVGRRRLALVHIPEHDVIVAFDRRVNGLEVLVEDVDFFGNTDAHGRLQRAFVHNGPMWAVWLHYFPHTDLVK